MPSFVNQQPPTQDLVALQRRQKMAEQLMQQSQQPMEGQMVSGHYVAPSWTQYLAKGLQGYMGKKGLEETDKGIVDLQTAQKAEEQRKIAEALQQFQQKANPSQLGTGATDQVNAALPPEMQIGAQPQIAPREPDLYGAYSALAGSGVPALQQAGMQGVLQMPQIQATQQERVDNRTFREQEAKANRDARMAELDARMKNERLNQQERLAAQKELREMQIQASRDNAKLVASLRQAPQAQIIQTEQGPMQFQGGRAVPILGPDNKPVTGKPSGAAAAPATQKIKDATDALATITMAEKLIDKATGSGIGSALDTTAAFFGKSTEGAQAAAQLKALEGDLVAKMPKMSGPQSDKDVLLYRQMAGQIGDPGVPAETKKAALKSIRQMQNRYAGVAPEGEFDAPPANPAAPKRLKFDAQGNIIP